MDRKHHFNSEQKPFPELKNGKIDTLEFLEASRGVVLLIDKFGKAYAPMSYDVNGNVNKLQRTYDGNPDNSQYLEDMIQFELNTGSGVAIDALLWLRRALNFFLIIFQSIVENEKEERISVHMDKAYSQTLAPYHGWATKQMFYVFKKMAPTRNKFLLSLCSQQSDLVEDLLKDISVFVTKLSVLVQHLKNVYSTLGLESSSIVS